MKTNFAYRFILIGIITISAMAAQAQIKYYSNGQLTIGNTTPFNLYTQTLYTNGVYMKAKTSNYFQIDVTPGATRLASHGDQVVFYNTQTGVYNDIQVKKVYNYSDARAKTNIKPLSYSLDILNQLNPVSYNPISNSPEQAKRKEMGLLAQDVEKILPELVYTDEEGKKSVDYVSLVPILINAVNHLSNQLKELKSQQQ
ncbi:tail fiber domain-containing protein [Bacteroides sp. AN502]|nr:tail fiber domain-containing protein [Caecibacteroides pullorum]MDC6281473.1 tail fiber domain-containing protein [Caecibacteroides pullorum]